MATHTRTSRRTFTFGLAALLCALALALAAATSATAAPDEPTLTVAELQALLDASPGGTVDGYFKTVLKGSEIVRIPVTVQATVPYSIPEGSLVLFQARGPAIEAIGGIAHGMSGSPLYVDDGGVDALVGAVAYGDIFTKGYLGLATPVEYMAAMEDTFLPAASAAAGVALRQPLPSAGRTLTRVVVARSTREARAVPERAGTAVMAPLATVAISGLPRRSAAYEHLADLFEQRGCDVAPYGAHFAGSAPTFQTPLVGGAGVAVLLARGDVLFGAAGTVTWSDGDRVVLFGHPFLAAGSVQFFLANAVVNGVWSSDYDPYKLMTPGSVRGSVLEDRNAGVAGRVGDMPAESPVTAAVTLLPQGVVGRETSFMTRWSINGPDALLAPDILAAAGYNASDYALTPGGATATTTIVVSDGVSSPRTVVRSNTWDNPYDVLGVLPSDAARMLEILTTDPDGTATASILSVDLRATASPARTAARIVDVRFPDGLRAGAANRVEVVLDPYGQTAPLVVEGTLALPAGASTAGSVSSFPAATGPDGGGGDDPLEAAARTRASGGDSRQTVAQRVAEVEALPTNDQLTVLYTPDSVSPSAGPETGARLSGGLGDAMQATLTAPGRYVTGTLQRRTGRVSVRVSPATARYRGALTISGVVAETGGETTVDLYARPYGATEKTRIATVTAEPDGGGARFHYRASGFTTTTRIIAEWAGDAVALGASGGSRVAVAQAATLSADRRSVPAGGAVRLTARVLPGKAGQPVRFERRAGGSWVLLKTVKATVGGATGGATAVFSWAPPAGATVVRAHVPATAANAATTSPALTIAATRR